jgi:putative DNA primase/helicase
VGRRRRAAHRPLARAALPLQPGQEARDAGGDGRGARRAVPSGARVLRVAEVGRHAAPATWLARYCGASESEYTQLAGKKFLIGAVARVMRPGCKMDNVLVLEGEQGRWKSTALATLAGIEWFGDTPFTIGDKDAFLVTRGSLIYELRRARRLLARGVEPREGLLLLALRHLRAEVRRARDQGAAPAGVRRHGEPRHVPARHDGQPALLAGEDRARGHRGLARDRDQLWAEAVHEFNAGTRWWVEEASASSSPSSRSCATSATPTRT